MQRVRLHGKAQDGAAARNPVGWLPSAGSALSRELKGSIARMKPAVWKMPI